jgi:type I restriction enzyme M protein
MKRTTSSEVHAYKYILDELNTKKGWQQDQIFTQNEYRKIKPIKKLLGKLTPENIVKISEEIFYVIEAKNEREKVDKAVKEAKEYASLINKDKNTKALFITGLAGNDREGFICKSQYLLNDNWENIKENGIDITSLLSSGQVERILTTKNPNLKEIEISDAEFLKSAEEINGILHEGGINKDYRARVMSAVLLALIEGTEINLDESPTVLISSINSRVDLVLKKHNKPDFARFIKIELPSSADNHNKFKRAIILTIQELLSLNIRSAMQSGNDVLGKFYEVFLKYGNGAKEIGIVLTPRHITKLSAEVLDIKVNDLVLDPTCGTGGFLVAAFDKVRSETKSKEKFDEFKKYGLYGIEQQDPVVSLALVNMIFRGDGKNNIVEGDCFSKWLNAKTIEQIAAAEYLRDEKKDRVPPITKILMNPPFPKKKTDIKEYLFLEQALRQMQDEGVLFSVLPYSCMIKQGSYLQWRKRLLKANTLLSVITFPGDLFYPIGVVTVGIIIKKGIPHPKKQPIFWIRALNDGFKKRKGKRLRHDKTPNDFLKVKDNLRQFVKDQTIKIKNIPEFQKACEIDFSDKGLELCPEAYLDNEPIKQEDIEYSIDDLIRGNLAFKIKYGRMFKKENKGNAEPYKNLFKKLYLAENKFRKSRNIKPNIKKFNITELFRIERGDFHAIDQLDEGKTPTISRVSVDNGLVGFYEKPSEARIYNKGIITISTVTGDAFFQTESFMATDNVLLCFPKEKYALETLLYITASINKVKWRYSYGRQPYKRIFQKTELLLPAVDDKINEEYIKGIVNNNAFWEDFCLLYN